MTKNESENIVENDSPESYYAYCMELEQGYRVSVLNTDGSVPDDVEIIRRLREDCEWADRGAEALVMLARQYGAFILRNALALAKVMDIEDGGLGL